MALADTAKLVATLELQDKFTKPLAGANRSLSNFERNLGGIGKGVGQVGAGVGRIATNLLKLGVAGGVALGGFIGLNLRAGVEQVKLLESAMAQTEAVIKSTGGVAGETADDIRNLALKYEDLNAIIDDKVIQSGENLLLTFTNIRKDAFEPALEAALNMNQALGGGEQGLQDTIIRLGKALNDPIKGIAQLHRVGVNFSEDQKKQIKQLVAQNDLFGAQQVILQELGKEFGGSFARAGDTAAAHTERLHDKVEDLQRVFAGPFASVVDRITVKLGDFLSETGTVDAVTRLGSAIAGLFTDEGIDRGIDVLRGGLDLLSPASLGKAGDAIGKAFDVVKSIDFETIGKGLQITAGIAKTAIDAFLSLPPEVQSVAIAALAANKLSGGLIGSGVGNIAKGLAGLLTGGGLLGRGSSAANPLWVQSVGGISGPGPTGPGGLPLLGLGLGPVLLAAATIGSVLAGALFTISPDRSPDFGSLEGRGGPGRNPRGTPKPIEAPILGPKLDDIDTSTTAGQRLLASIKEEQRVVRVNTADSARWQGLANAELTKISAKKFDPTVNVNVAATANISVSNIARTLTSFRIAGSSSIGGHTESAY